MTPLPSGTTKDARIKALEGNRDQWRRIAFRLSDALEKYDEAAARAIFEAADVLQPTDTERSEGT